MKTDKNLQWGFSSIGRAPALQAEGHEFDSRNLHHRNVAQLIEHAPDKGEVVGL